MDKGEWIPCSERVPETEEWPKWGEYLTCDKKGIISVTHWADGWNCFLDHNGELYREYEKKDVVAWMPLPEPYKGGEEENEEI